jgi:hypothetical protein
LAKDDHSAGVDDAEHDGEAPIGQGAAEQPVDAVQVVTQNRDGNRDRKLKNSLSVAGGSWAETTQAGYVGCLVWAR